ncbi:MAG: hypothetical protein EOO31_05400 [Comamonadaceae bacterium]|nr:MAG: hypothetical protein EOO31_05400 [Comamonadaceae bacterium]
MSHPAFRIFAATTVAALAAGCVAVPGDPYYDANPYYPPTSSVTVYEQPGYIYTNPRVYPVPYPAYSPPPPRYGWQRDRDNDWRDRHDRDVRDGHRRDADRREADRREGDRRRDADRQRDQAERDRRAQHQQQQQQQDRDRRAQQERDRDRNRDRGQSPAAAGIQWPPGPPLR